MTPNLKVIGVETDTKFAKHEKAGSKIMMRKILETDKNDSLRNFTALEKKRSPQISSELFALFEK